MEGNGEGLVAIVEGLDTPGVTLTVCSRPRLHLDRRRASRHRLHVNPINMAPETCSIYQGDIRVMQENSRSTSPEIRRMSVETTTVCTKGTECGKSTTGAQICDGRYASSYKMAHCMVTPTSPPEAVSEFPPQRKEPCRNQGNFQIGQQWNGQDNGHASAQTNGPSGGHGGCNVRVTASRVKHCRGSQMSGEKGSSHHYRSSYRDMEAFAQSLRKYPNGDPYRTASTDLIEKIIRYTQARSSQEPSRTTKSMRSLQQQKSSDTNDLSSTSRHQQTYSRRNYNVTSNNCHQQGRFKLYSDSRNIKQDSSDKECFSSSYDYLKAANSRSGRIYHSDGSPSPDESRSREESSQERSRSPVRSKSHVRSSRPDRTGRPDIPGRLAQSPFSSMGNLSMSDVSKFIRSITIKPICKEKPLVFQVCPKLKNRYNQHKKICPSKNDRSSELFGNAAEDQASGSYLSRLISSFSGGGAPSATREACQCSRKDCCCSKATQCSFGPDTSNNQAVCTCKSSSKSSSNIPCNCSGKYQEQEYYNKRIDEEIFDWLKGVPVRSFEGPEFKKKREVVIRDLQNTLKQLPYDENFDENATNVINKFVDDYPMWNPDAEDEESHFKNQLAEKLTDHILSIPRQSDRFKDIVKKWIANLNLEDDDEIDIEIIIDNIVNRLKSLAAERPVCDIKYTRILNCAIMELLIELSLFDGDMVTLKKMANKLANEAVAIPKNVAINDVTSDLTAELKEIVCDWICEHGMCKELKKNPNLIYGLAMKLKEMQSHGINDTMKEEMNQFEDDVGKAFKTIDELMKELTNQVSNNEQFKEKLILSNDELVTLITDWLRTLPGATDLNPQEFDKITKELVKLVQNDEARGYDSLGIDIVDCLLDTNVPIDPIEVYDQVEEVLRQLNVLPSNRFYKEKAQKKLVRDIFNIIDRLPVPEDKKEEMKSRSRIIIHKHLDRSDSNFQQIENKVKKELIDDIVRVISDEDMLRKSIKTIKSATKFSSDSSDLKEIISKDVKSAVNELPIDAHKKKHLMQQVNGTLSKNMNKPLPYNVKSCINSGISDIVEKCPIAEDRGVVCCLKKLLSAVAMNHLNMFLSKPKCVCEIQSKLEKDVGIVIDNSPIDADKKRVLKKCIQNILKENEACRLSDQVIKSLKADFNGAVNDLLMPEDKKDMLKNAVGETVSKNVGEACAGLRHDLYKIKNKLLDDTIQVIEKCPVSKEVKSHLISKLEPMLARNLDSSLSHEEKYIIIDDVSEIFKDTMPEDKRKRLESKLAKNLDTHRTEEDQTGRIEIINNSLNNTLQEMEKAINEAPLPKDKKALLNNNLREMANATFKKPLTDDAQDAFNNYINKLVNELNISNDKKNQLKRKLIQVVDKNMNILRKDMKDLETKPLYTQEKSSIDLNGKYGKNGKALMPIKELDESKSRRSVKRDKSGTKYPYARTNSDPGELRRTKSSSVSITGPMTPKETMKHEVKRTVKKAQIPEEKKSKLRLELTTMLSSLFPDMDNYPDPLVEGPLEVSPQGSSKVLPQGSPRVPPQGSPTVHPQGSPKVPPQGSPKVSPQGSPKVPPQGSPKVSPQGSPRVPPQGSLKVSPQGSPKISSQGSPKVFPQGSPKVSPQGSPKVSPQGSPKVSPKVLSQGEKRYNAQCDELTDGSRKIALEDEIKDLFSKYGIDPGYQKQLMEELNNLVDLVLSAGDLEEARRKLIEKIMRDMNLSYEEACALADELIERARKLAAMEALKDIFTKYGIASSYENQLAQEFTKVVDVAFTGGDLEEARKQLLNNIIQNTKLSDKQSSALTDEIMVRARNLAAKEELRDMFKQYGIASSYENQLAEEFTKLVDKAPTGEDLKDARKTLIKKIMQDTKLSEKQASALADEVIKRARKLAVKEELRDVFNRYDIAANCENQVAEEFNKLVDVALLGGDLDEARKKHLDKTMRDIQFSEDQATALTDELIVKAREKLLASKAKDSCAISFLYEKCFTKAVRDAVEQSSVSASEKSSLKETLLTKLKENINEIRFINDEDIETIKNKTVADCYDIVDATSVQSDQKDELKLSLKEGLDKCVTEVNEMLGNDDEAFAEYEDKLRECIKDYMDYLGIQVDPEILEAFIKDLDGDIIDRHKYLNAHPEIIVTKKDEMENFNYQVFRRAKKHMGLKTTLQIMKGAGELYKMILALGPPLPSKLRPFSRREQAHYSGTRRPDPVLLNRKHTGAFLSGSVNFALQESLARNKFARKQWSKTLSDINYILSATRKPRVEASRSNKRPASPRGIIKAPSSRLTNLLETFALNKTEQKTPFNSKKSKDGDEREFTKFLTDNMKSWLKTAGIKLKDEETNQIVKDLTLDIVDRHKYLQIFGSDLSSQCTDLDFFKLQLHRRLNTLVPPATLKPVIENAQQFLAILDSYKIPQMVEAEAGKGKKQSRDSTASTEGVNEEGALGGEASGMSFSPAQSSTPAKPRTSSDMTGKKPSTQTTTTINHKTKPNPPNQNTMYNKLKAAIRTWVDTVKIELDEEAKTEVSEEIATDVVERQEYIKLYPEKVFTKEDEIENLRFQVINKINKVIGEDADVDICKEKIEELYKTLMGLTRSLTPKQAEEFLSALNEEVTHILSNYAITGRDRAELQPTLACELLKLKNSSVDQDDIVENMIVNIKRFNSMRTCHPCDEEAEEIALKLLYRSKKIITRILDSKPTYFHGCPMSDEKRSLMESQLAEEYARELGIPLGGSQLAMNESAGKSRYGLSFNGLTKFIDSKISNINSDDETLDEGAKKEIAYSLIQAIGEMNVDPAIFNDDALYEAVLRDELQNLFGNVSLSEEEMQALKEDLLEKILEAHNRAHDEIAGQIYKQELRETISKVLPDQRKMSMEEQASLETAKDQLADAFIDLHYSGGSDNQINKLKTKIAYEINEFCKIFMNRNPCLPMNAQKISRDLHTALMNVPVPAGDSIMYEVEQARIREEINDWLRELPLRSQNTVELLCRNKMIYVLSKKLFDIEAEGEDPDNELMKKEIVKFLNKMPLEPEEDFETHADRLIDKLRSTENSRKYDATANVTIDACGNITAVSAASDAGGSICPAYKSFLEKQNASASSKVCGRPSNKPPEPFPPCTLSSEDRNHLDSIKRRTLLTPDCVRALMRSNKCNVVCPPRPIDAESQTILKPVGMEMLQQNSLCPVANDKAPRPCPGVPVGSSHQPCSQARRPESFGMEKPYQNPCPSVYEKITRPCPATSSKASPLSGRLTRRPTISSSNMPACMDEVQPQVIIKQYYWNPDRASYEESELPQTERRTWHHQSNVSPFNQAQNAEPKSQRQTPTDRNSFWDPQKSFHRTTPCPRTPCMPSPCNSPFGFDHNTPPCSPGYSKDNDSRSQKRDGLQDQIPYSSSRRSRKERVIELGSLDDICNARPKKRNSDNETDWSTGKFQEDDNFWSTPLKRVVLDEGTDDSLIMEREQREERIRCKCKERLVPKCGRSQSKTSPRTPQQGEQGLNLIGCSKCCGLHCPYPSYFYFK